MTPDLTWCSSNSSDRACNVQRESERTDMTRGGGRHSEETPTPEDKTDNFPFQGEYRETVTPPRKGTASHTPKERQSLLLLQGERRHDRETVTPPRSGQAIPPSKESTDTTVTPPRRGQSHPPSKKSTDTKVTPPRDRTETVTPPRKGQTVPPLHREYRQDRDNHTPEERTVPTIQAAVRI